MFAVLDADMIPREEFLEKTVGYFSDENMAFVQTPQVYYNQDMYQYNLKKNIPNEQDFFMRDIQEARASRDAVLHVGTNAVFRKNYVDEIGGYPTCSITEDMAVGMLLQEKGYSSTLVNEDLVLGLSATTFTELVKQRDRWCRGNLQVLKNFNPLSALNYSATHKKQNNLIYVLDALDAFNKKLVKKIQVKGFEVKNFRGTDSYLFLESIVLSSKKPPMAKIEFEIKRHKKRRLY